MEHVVLEVDVKAEFANLILPARHELVLVLVLIVDLTAIIVEVQLTVDHVALVNLALMVNV